MLWVYIKFRGLCFVVNPFKFLINPYLNISCGLTIFIPIQPPLLDFLLPSLYYLYHFSIADNLVKFLSFPFLESQVTHLKQWPTIRGIVNKTSSNPDK